MKEQIEKITTEFDNNFPALKSGGHKKIHRDNHKAHDGTKCNEQCIYVNIAIKDFITKAYQAGREDEREEVLKYVQFDVDFGIENKQVISTTAQKYLLSALTNNKDE